MQQDSIFTGGFADPVFEAQAVFRTVMDGLANPGRIGTVDGAAQAPASVPKAMAALALTLLDHDTPVLLGPGLRDTPFAAWLAFHTGAPLADNAFDAAFALWLKAGGFPGFEGLAIGSDEYPDRSTTVIAEIPALEGGPPLLARGPGIRGSITLSPSGLPADFVRRWQENNALYPRGIDLVLVSGDRMLCLPRTTRLQAMEG